MYRIRPKEKIFQYWLRGNDMRATNHLTGLGLSTINLQSNVNLLIVPLQQILQISFT